MIHETKSMRWGCRHSLGNARGYLLLYNLVPLEGVTFFNTYSRKHATPKSNTNPKKRERKLVSGKESHKQRFISPPEDS